jgi:alpha-D-xyloside xylohydrolase
MAMKTPPMAEWRRAFATLFVVLVGLFSAGCGRTSPERTSNGVVVRLAQGALKLELHSARTVRVVFDPTGRFDPRPRLVVRTEPSTVRFDLRPIDDGVELKTAALVVRVQGKTGAVSFHDLHGGLLLRENPARPRAVTPAVVLSEATHAVRQNFLLSADEGLYGLGQYPDGVMNYRGHDVTMTQSNGTVVVPFLVSTRRFGLLWDNYSKTKFHDGPDGCSFWSEVGDVVDYYFIAGADMDDVVRGYRQLTGAAPLFAKWAYGYFQSKERYKTGQELIDVVSEYRRRGLPIDTIVQDWRYWGGEDQWSGMRFDEGTFPDAAGLIAKLHQQYHAHLMISIWPVLGRKTDIFDEMKSKGHLFEPEHWTKGRVYDAYSKEARDIYWRYVRDGLFAKGVDAFWMDATEPEFQDAGEPYIKAARRNALGTMARYLNTYSLMTTGGVYEGQRATTGDKRVFILTRSAFAGQQRYAAATWSGDITADWSVLRNQVAAGMNLSMAGIPYWTTDIGAFYVTRQGIFDEGCRDPAYREMYVRWFEFGAFCPIFRSHGTSTPREIWRFGEPGSWSYDALRKYDRLRYRLLPYIYSLAWEVTNAGYTLMRGLPMDFPDDLAVRAIGDQFMFGPSILVSPVTEHMYYGEDAASETIPSQNLYTADGQRGGLTAAFYNGANFESLVAQRVQDSAAFEAWGEGMPSGLAETTYCIRWTGEIQSQAAGTYEFWLSLDDGARMWLDGRLLVNDWGKQGGKTYKVKVPLRADTRYALKIEHGNKKYGTEMRLGWRTPGMKRVVYDPSRVQTRSVYLPGTGGWTDFWTGERLDAGTAVDRAVPIDVMPLYVRAGSIVPLGPHLQWAEERRADPIELRVYPGADASFTLYEDEGDSYRYERGARALIDLHWNDQTRCLTIGERKGSFPGMFARRTFDVVWVRPGHGTGVDPEKVPDAVVQYEGQARPVCRQDHPSIR